jgi:transcriptional regulator with XRE-family HTH domain
VEKTHYRELSPGLAHSLFHPGAVSSKHPCIARVCPRVRYAALQWSNTKSELNMDSSRGHAEDVQDASTAGVAQRAQFTNEVVARLRALRRQRGLSAREIADRCAEAGVPSLSRSTIAKIESGVRDFITVEEVGALATALDVRPADLLSPASSSRASRPAAALDVWNNLPARDRGYARRPAVDAADADSDQIVGGSDQDPSPEGLWVTVDLRDASFATPSQRPVVPDGRISELPFPLEHWEDFERLVVALAIDVDDLVEVRRYGTLGQAQDGIDVIGCTRLGHHAQAYQCKNVHDFDESDLARAIAKYISGGRPFNPQRLVLAVATNANRTQLVQELQDIRAENPDLVVELWDGPKISELLRKRPRLVEQFFGEEVARRFCFSSSFPASTGEQPSAESGGVPLEIIMRGPIRSLGFDARFDEAVGEEQSDPGAAAFTFADIADRLSGAGYGGYADALRRRAVRAYNSASRYSDAAWLQLSVVSEAILAGRWGEVQGTLWVLHQLLNEQSAHGETVDAGLTALVLVLDAAHDLFGDPVLLPESTGKAVAAAASHLDTLLGSLPTGPVNRSVLLRTAAAAIVTAAECALAAEASDAITAATDVLDRIAATFRSSHDKTLCHYDVRLRLALAEARSPLAADSAVWEELQNEATGWKLDDRDAALVLARYACARAAAGVFADADIAWQRATEFGTRARLFSDIAGWLSSQIQLRFRLGPADLAEIGDMRQMTKLLSDQPSDRIVPIAGVREEVLDALRRGAEGLRTAALAAQRMRVLAVAGGLWEDELEAHGFLGDIYERSGEPLLSVFHRIRAGEADAAGKVASETMDAFLDVTAELNRPTAAERSAAYTVFAAQGGLIPDESVNVIAKRARDDIEDVRAGKITQSMFSGRGVLVSATHAAAAVAGRLTGQLPEQLMATLDWRLAMGKDTVIWTDEPHLGMLVSIAASDDDGNASAAFERIARLFALESPALRGHGRDLAPAVKRRPGSVRKVLTYLTEQGSQHAAEMLAGWSLTGKPGRDGTRVAAEESAWQAAAHFAEQAAARLASPPEGTPGRASLIVGFTGDAGLVTILDPADIDGALAGLLHVAADRLHLAATRQQALTASSILVAGDTGDRLGTERLAEVFSRACEYARGVHEGSAMDDMTSWTHPLSSGRINMGDISLVADGLCLASRASRAPEERDTVLNIAAQIVRGQPAEIVLNGVAHALAALPSLTGAPPSVAVASLINSPSPSLRSAGILHWALTYAPAGAEEDIDDFGRKLAEDSSPVVRRGLANNLLAIAARSGLSRAGGAAATVLSDDPYWDIRKAAREATIAVTHSQP